MSVKENALKISEMDKRLWRMEKLLWVIMGILGAHLGFTTIPSVVAGMGG